MMLLISSCILRLSCCCTLVFTHGISAVRGAREGSKRGETKPEAKGDMRSARQFDDLLLVACCIYALS